MNVLKLLCFSVFLASYVTYEFVSALPFPNVLCHKEFACISLLVSFLFEY
eukprot:m.175606 g.175606  ORF g.175606 m.175606 type:complete len:50 (+) comp16549_c2_seq3:1673-1822(+)